MPIETMNKIDKAMKVSVGIKEEVSLVDISYIQKIDYKITRYKKEYDKYHDITSKIVSELLEDTLIDYCESHNIKIESLNLHYKDNIGEYYKKASC
jgi:hypothetical protein